MTELTYVPKEKVYSEAEKLKAAYALNMCTVSVSQIVDYNDAYILEQEYDAILNNLNLKEIPKDEALLKVLSALLDTITFFRIQEIQKGQIEKKYQQRIKNAIWSAIPSFSVITVGNPISTAISIVTQIGSSYMNYRKEKASISSDREDDMIKLQIAAIEQFNGLKRELFTTAWRLADEYDFVDEWRLSEKQIKQYNDILMDADDYRKYARLETIADKFVAYPPFWYFYGHTANYIAEMAKQRLAKNKRDTKEQQEQYELDFTLAEEYIKLAKSHFEHYFTMCRNNILREDQLTASFALEYVDILNNESSQDVTKISELIHLAEKMAPLSYDILQLCVVSYLRIGATDDAARLLKVLVNENYNKISNIKLLSSIYVKKYLLTQDSKLKAEYAFLRSQVNNENDVILYPWQEPSNIVKDSQSIEQDYFVRQKGILGKQYRISLNNFVKKETIEFNEILPAPGRVEQLDKYYDNSSSAQKKRLRDAEAVFNNKRQKEIYISRLSECNIRAGYASILDKTVEIIDRLPCFRNSEKRDMYLDLIGARIKSAKKPLLVLENKIADNTFDYDDFKKLVQKYNYEYFTKNFFDNLYHEIDNVIWNLSDMKQLEKFESDLSLFCSEQLLPDPDQYIRTYSPKKEFSEVLSSEKLPSLFGEEGNNTAF